MENIGQMPMITINSTTTHAPINITGGPAMPYKYRLSQVRKVNENIISQANNITSTKKLDQYHSRTVIQV